MQTITHPLTTPDSQSGTVSDRHPHISHTFAITSGKGGVGKSNLTVNLAVTLARQGARVCIFDADTGLANINILLGLTPEYTIEHVLDGSKTLPEILVEGPEGISLVPGASGIARCADLSRPKQKILLDALKELEQRFDYLLFDTAAGIGGGVTRFIAASQHVVLVITPEPTSLTDAFAMLRVLQKQKNRPTINVVVNMVNSYEHSREIFHRFNTAVEKYLNLDIRFMGYVTRDEYLRNAVRMQLPLLITAPTAMASRCIERLGQVMISQFGIGETPASFSDQWQQFINDTDMTAVASPASIEDIHLQVNVFLQQHYNTQDAMDLLHMIVTQVVDHAEHEKDVMTESESQALAEQAEMLITELRKLSGVQRHTTMTQEAQAILQNLREMTEKIGQQRELLDEKLRNLYKELE